MNTDLNEKMYPEISDKLLERLEEDFPNELPTKYIDSYELGFLLGQQSVINKLKFEKKFSEQS